MTAMSALKGKPTAQIKRLMNGRDVVDVPTWTAKVNKKFPWTLKLHSNPTKDWECKLDPKPSADLCPGNVCLLPAIKHFFGKLTHKLTPEQEAENDLTLPPGQKLSDSDMLHFLIHLLGELHQPLQLGFVGDETGKKISVHFRGKDSTLFDLWDAGFTQAMIADRPGHWYGGWTHVNAVKAQYEKEKAEFSKGNEVALFDQWAQENLEIACNKIYKDPTSNDRITPAKKLTVTPHIDRQWEELVRNRILVAGARTAIVLNSILESREAMQMKKESGMGVEDNEEVQQRKKTRQADTVSLYARNFAINFVIMLVVLAVFFFVNHVMSGHSAGSAFSAAAQFAKKKMEDAKETYEMSAAGSVKETHRGR